MAARSYPPNWVFSTAVAEFATMPGSLFAQDALIGDVARAVRGSDRPVAVCSPDGALVAIVDATTIVDLLMRGVNPNERLPSLTTPAAQAIPATRSAFAALLKMHEMNTAALAVVAPGNRFAGFVTRDAILSSAAGFVHDVVRAAGSGGISSASGARQPTGYNAMRQCQVDIAGDLLDAGLPVWSILSTITEINNEVHRCIVADAINALESDGWGSPPAQFAFLVMGSSGRHENYLDPDQDNALVIGDLEGVERQAAETYFITLAERVCDGLAAAGFPYCKGNMMATSPVWRKTASEWRAQLLSWVRRKHPTLLMNCDTLLDFAHVAGDISLATGLRQTLFDFVRHEPGFLRALYSIEEDHGVALDWLGRLSREKDDFGTVPEVNVKLRGTLPLLEGARLLAVSAGITETSTVGRLKRLGAARIIDEEAMNGLIDAYETLASRLLRHQIAKRQSSLGSSIRIAHDSMSRSEKTDLREALKRISRFRTALPNQLERASASPMPG